MSTMPLIPHTDVWFERLKTAQPDVYRNVRYVVEKHGKYCCSVCGDTPQETPVDNYQQQTLPSHTMRFCDDCLQMQTQLHHIPWVKMAEP